MNFAKPSYFLEDADSMSKFSNDKLITYVKLTISHANFSKRVHYCQKLQFRTWSFCEAFDEYLI